MANLRLIRSGMWHGKNFDIGIILFGTDIYTHQTDMPSDAMVPIILTKMIYNIKLSVVQDLSNSVSEPMTDGVNIFTGSRADSPTGSGVFIENDSVKLHFSRGTNDTVFQEEIFPILMALGYVADKRWKNL